MMNLSQFQITVLERIEQRPAFKRHVLINGKDMRELNEDRRPGPINMLWYDTSMKLHVWRVGQRKILHQI